MKTENTNRKDAFKAARKHYGRKKLRGLTYALMGGNKPYHLFIFKGEPFEIR